MTLLWHTQIKNIDYYLDLPEGSVVYVLDLKHQAFSLIKEGMARDDFKVYKGNVGRTTKKTAWMKHLTYGQSAPTTLKIEFSNKVKLLDYSLFDKEMRTEKEMEPVVKILNEFGNQTTGCGIIKQLLPENIASIPTNFLGAEDEDVEILQYAMRGGANSVRIYDEVKNETHIDYHQLYASVMITHNFPYLKPILKNGYFPHEFGLYMIAGGRARLKKTGFPLLSLYFGQNEMFGADGEWHNCQELISISNPDLQLLFENYEVEDLEVAYTLYYPNSFSGEAKFGDVVKMIYNGRRNNTGAVKSFYKLMNEYLAGYFERTGTVGNWWSDLTSPNDCVKMLSSPKNPIVGIFITAYGRQMLNKLLHMFPHDKVIGYDTDCCFFAGTPEQVPQKVLDLFGEGLGQLHFDGIYQNVIHKASKSYSGYDTETKQPFKKQSGVSKTGKIWCWNKQTQEYFLKEVKYEE